ncbi:MAG: helix-turn-helix domain-containing protein [Defluviitaleaceae bacterium]|nr:helix-turn-helix domain-containing protein [Defluviitaleaceae bacterium]
MTFNIGENIKQLRAEKGVTQEQLAEHLGITYQSVSKWENNITAPDLHDGLDAKISIFYLALDLQVDNRYECSGVIENDPYGVAKKWG